jgi:ATP-dependent RNA helicase RhlE
VRTALMYGGVPKARQAKAVANGVDVLVATPGRLLDHMQEGAVTVSGTEILVLDEADHMLDLGFIVPIRRIVGHISTKRQTLFFSATMPKEIAALAGSMLRDPVHVAVAPVATTAERVEQKVIFVEAARKRQVLAEILRDKRMQRTLVFTRTKHGADKVAHHLEAVGQPAAAIHGNKSQPQRERALAAFKEGRVRILVATDIAARGIDVDGVTHVVNFDLPNVPEAYVHRIGRTARAGHAGVAISFCDSSERAHLRGIEKLIRARLPVEDPVALAA